MLSDGIEEKLMNEAKKLLIEASKDKNGIIIETRDFDGLTIQTNERNFVEKGNKMSEILWECALNQLCEEGLVKEQGFESKLYKITNNGYLIVDKLS